MSKEEELKARSDLDQRLQERNMRSQWEKEAFARVRHACKSILAEEKESLRVNLMVFWAQKLVEEHNRCGFPYDDPLNVISLLESGMKTQ